MTVRPRLHRALTVAAVAVLLAGCVSDARSTGPARASSSALSGAAGPSAPATSPSPTTDMDAPAVLLLQGDGLGVIGGDSSVAPLPFATTTGEAVRLAVEDALGPTATTALPDCPQGPREAVGVDGFTVLLDGDRFVGWTDTGAQDRSLTTSDGLGTGSRLDELQSVLPDVQVAQGPAGPGWSSLTGLSGLLDGLDPASTVTAISAGQTCGR